MILLTEKQEAEVEEAKLKILPFLMGGIRMNKIKKQIYTRTSTYGDNKKYVKRGKDWDDLGTF